MQIRSLQEEAFRVPVLQPIPQGSSNKISCLFQWYDSGSLDGIKGRGGQGERSSILTITSSMEAVNGPGDSILIDVSAAANRSESSTE